jgi:photosystem II stability/assembly factor-like uncharacterized protein/pectate lyase
MKPYRSCLLACLRFVPVVLAVALSAVASAASGWVDISGNLPAGIDRGQTQLVAVHFINDTEGWVCDANLKAVYHTTDGGASWSTIAVPGASGGRAPTAIFMKSATEGWIGCDDGRLYHTSDGWTTWTGIYSTGERIYDIDCGPGATAAIAVGDKGACFALTATGATRLSGPSITLPTDNNFMSVSAPTAGEAWIGTSGAATSIAYLYHSVDGMLQTDQAGYHDSGILGVFMRTNKVGHMLTGQFDPNSNTWLDSGINSTVDGVNWWVNTNVPSTHVIKIGADGRSMQSTIVFSDVALVSADEGWIVGSDGWILHTTNATETATRCANGWAQHGSYSAEDAAATVWTREGEGLTELAFNRVFFPSANAGYAIGTGDMLGASNLHHRAALFKRNALLGPATITFAVTEGSAPVPGATITFNGVSAQTDAAGHATVVLPAASVPIEHRYTVEAAGLMSEARYLALGAGATTKTEAIEMRPIPGEFVRLATEAPGVRTGFSRPQDVHVDASGNLWVLDVSASSVQQYNAAGALVSEWSLGIDNVYARRAVTEFERDASGNWYVLVRPYADWERHGVAMPGEVRKYDSTGNLLATWTGTPQTGSFGGISALALDHSGNVYLGTVERGILKLDSSGNLLDRFGCGVTLDANGNEIDGDGQMPLAWVTSLAVDSTGRIYAGEASGEDAITRVAGQSNYIAVYSAAGRFVARWGGSTEAAGALFRGAVQSLVCDASDRVVAIDPKANRVQTFSSTGTVANAWGTYGVDDGKLDGPCRLGRDPGGNLYLVEGAAARGYSGAAAKSRIQKFTATGTWQRTWTGTTATVDGSFDTPWGVGVAPTGEVYVTDYDRNRVQKFAADGTFLLGFGASGSGDGQFNHPTGVAVDASGNVYVGDRYNDRVQVFSSNGTFLRKFGASGTSGLGSFCYVDSVAIGPDGNVYVGDQRSLQKFSPDGTALARWGSYGSGTGQFYSINGIGFDAAGNIYTTEWDNHRVQVFDSAGSFLRTWGRRGEDDGEFLYGFGLAFDAAGYLYVSDNARVQGFTTDGDFVTRFGPNDGGDGEFGRPHGLARSPTTGALYLADTRTKALYRCPAPVIAHRVSFSVTDRGQALAGATVAINGVSVVTDSTGVVSLWLPTGSYPYTVTRADYASGSGTLTVGATSAVEAVSLLRLSGISLVVKVTDPRSQPLANVKVVLDGTTLRYTDSLGTAIIGGSGRGVHTYVASTPGFETASASFEQTSSGFVLTIVLQSSRTVLTAPTTTTGGVNAVSVSAANLSGEVTADGGASITARGVVCSLSANPTLDTGTAFISGVIWNNGVVTDLGTGAFTATAIGLSAGTTYHYRAYATNSAGTSYGADATFATEPAVSGYGWTQQAAKLVAAGATSGSFFLRDIDHVTVDGTPRLFLTSGGTTAGSIVYRSDDGGTTFVATGAAADTFEALSVRPDGQTLFGAGYGKVWKSTDGGTSWTKSTLMGSGYFSDVHFVTDTVGYAVGGSGAGGVPYVHGFRTTDGGATWTEMTNRASPHDRGYYDAVWAPDATHPDTVWVAQGTGITYILHSTDGGTTWGESDTMDEVTDLYFKDANTGWGAGGIGRNCGIYRYVKGYWVHATTPPSLAAEESLNALAFAPDGLNGWAVGNEGIILHSTDGGATWEREGQSLDLPNRVFPGHRETLCGVTVVSAHEAYVVGNDGSLLKFGVLGSTETMLTVTTGAISAVAATSATAAGNVTADGGAGVTARGVVYGLLGNPTLATGTAVAAGSEMGGFTAAITGLSPSTTYHLRAYATNAAGTSYGDDVSFTTEAADTSAPAAPTITTGAGSTTDRTPTLGGVAEAGSTVTLYVDGVACGTTVAGGDGSWAFTLPAAVADGNHSITATATDAAGNTSAASGGSRLTVVATSFAAPVPDGYGAGATGGAAGTAVVAGTAEEFVTYAASSDAHVITVVGSLDIGTVAMASNKTIQGADASATLDGCLSLTNVSNIVIRGLNLANPDGTALRLSGASKVYVTRCSFLDAAAPQLVATGSDQLTVSWCEFAATVAGQSAVQLGGSGETTTPRITLHHNWWSTNLASALPAAASGQVHQYSNYVAVTGNTTGTAVSGTAQLFSEDNVYSGTANPLAKSGSARIRALDNTYPACTGTTDTGADTVFTPSYSYTLLDRNDLATLLPAQAGNVSGAGYTEERAASASITATATTVIPGASATLTAGLAGATATGYQWRLNNAPIPGAMAPTYTISSMAAANAGTYTVAVSLANGDTVVGTPATIALGTASTPPPTPTPTPDSNKGGGGGACGSLFALALGLFATLRRRPWRRS